MNGAADVYTRQATVDWLFNGTGPVSQTAPYDWDQANAKKAEVSASSRGWKEVTNGSTPRNTTGPVFNAALPKEKFNEKKPK